MPCILLVRPGCPQWYWMGKIGKSLQQKQGVDLFSWFCSAGDSEVKSGTTHLKVSFASGRAVVGVGKKISVFHE